MYKKFNRAFIAQVVLLLVLTLLTGTVYADPRVGPITPENSIIGANANDGAQGIIELPSGNVVIYTRHWNGERGAVMCLTPPEYRAGGFVMSEANSLVGSTPNDNIGGYDGKGVIVLSNGNYIVISSNWDNGSIANAGAVTWVNGSTCIPAGETTRGAVISANNSLVGSSTDDYFGRGFVALPSGNYVVGSSIWDRNGMVNAGAVVWVNGLTGAVGAVNPATSLVGEAANAGIGTHILALTNGNYIVASPGWDNGASVNVGAITWGDGLNGTFGVVSAANSIIGSTSNDSIGNGLPDRFLALPNGNYVIGAPEWDNGLIVNAGAAIWGNGNGGTVGVVNETNSLVGSTLGDSVGWAVTILANGHYIVSSENWNNDGETKAGAVTWANGDGSTVGFVSPANSLVGTKANHSVGTYVAPLTNGHYVVASRYWDNDTLTDVGAVTWANGDGSTVGAISTENSLIGSTPNDQVGGVGGLSNGNYLVVSTHWDNGAAINAGAVTWGNGDGGTVGVVSSANSLVGSTSYDGEEMGIIKLPNGNYVVRSYYWDNGIAEEAGAVAWGNGNGGTVGTISAANSLIGSNAYDRIGTYVTLLTNGHYVVSSPGWNNGSIINAGAVTWGNANGGTAGIITSTNSLIGSKSQDSVSETSVLPLSNGNYVVPSRYWDNGPIVDAGAVTWSNGNGGTVGTISAANSLVGSTANDRVGIYNGAGDFSNFRALPNGNYVIASPYWANGGVSLAGAITWGNGNGGTVGTISAANSLVGTTPSDRIGVGGVIALANGNYVALSENWTNGGAQNAGAITWGDGDGGTVGPISPANSLVGSTANDYVGNHHGIVPLNSGDYFVRTYDWHNGVGANVGAVTWSQGDTAPLLGVVVSKTNVTVKEGGKTASYTLALRSAPASPVTIDFGVDIQDQITLSVPDLTFDATTWYMPQAVTITAVDDEDTETQQTLTISHIATSDDLDYDNIAVNAVTVTVNDNDAANTPPILAEIGNRSGYLGETLTFDADATDTDDPAQTLTFSLDVGAPVGVAIDPSTGVFTWTLDGSVTPGDYPVTITVTDDGLPALSDSETITLSVGEINHLSNYGFETAGSSEKIAKGWAVKGATKQDRRICNTDVKAYAREGQCAYRFSSSKVITTPRYIQRNVNIATFAKGDTLELRGWVKANNITAGGRLMLIAKYANGKSETKRVNLRAGTYGYEQFSKQITLTRKVVKVTVRVQAGRATGIFYADELAVVEILSPALTIPDLRLSN